MDFKDIPEESRVMFSEKEILVFCLVAERLDTLLNLSFIPCKNGKPTPLPTLLQDHTDREQRGLRA